jgi:uncharacterized membrane protein
MANGVAAWRVASLYAMAGGIIGAVLAAVPGWIDLLTLRGSGAWTIGVSHMISNVTALILFILAFALVCHDRPERHGRGPRWQGW